MEFLQKGEDGIKRLTVTAPMEVLAIIEGPARPGANTVIDTPAIVMALLWGMPGGEPDKRMMSSVWLN